MAQNFLPGKLSYPKGTIEFGIGKPILCINDQMGYCIEKPEVLAELQDGCLSSLLKLAEAGMEMGINVVNVQLMQPKLDQLKLMPRVIELLVEKTGCCIAIDARDTKVVEAGLVAYPYKAMCNIVNGEKDNLKKMMPIIAKYGAAVGTALVYEKGIPETVKDRVLVAKRIIDAAEAHGISREDLAIDAVCLPIGVVPNSMQVTLETIKAFHEELGVPALLGISNAGYMMPNPGLIDLAYFVSGASWGLDVAMVDPCTPHLSQMTSTMDFLNGIDPYGVEFLRQYRKSLSDKQ